MIAMKVRINSIYLHFVLPFIGHNFTNVRYKTIMLYLFHLMYVVYDFKYEGTNEKYPKKTAELYGTAVCCTAYFPNFMPTQYKLHDPL